MKPFLFLIVKLKHNCTINKPDTELLTEKNIIIKKLIIRQIKKSMKIKRTFEFIEHAIENYPKEDAFSVKRNGKWEKFSTEEIKQKADFFSSWLIESGFQKGDKILTVSNNRPEWNIADIGMEQIGIIHVPVYPTMGKQEYEHLIKHSDAKMIITAKPEHYNRIKEIPEVKSGEIPVYSFDKSDAPYSFNDILISGEKTVEQNNGKLQQMRADVTEKDISSIIYTSGTTGQPKGVMLTHKNFVSNVLAQICVVPENVSKAISFLPLNHVYERSLNFLYIYLGVSIYYAESAETLVEDIQEVKPHVLATVPRLLEKIYDKIYDKGRELKGIKKSIFFSSLRSAQKYEGHKSPGLFLKAKLALDNKLVFDKWREALGGNIKIIVSGGAALQPRLARIFNAAQIPVCEGYGLTETSPVISVNRIGDIRPGTVGKLLETSEIKIDDDGEILYKGPCLMKGYYKDPELTEDVIDEDGWFHTGDMGELNGDILKITGRKKELFKLSTGKYVAPQLVENIMKESPFIEQLMVVGENERYCSAIISPNFLYLKKWASLHDIQFKNNLDLIKNEKVIKKFNEEIDELNFDVEDTMTIKKFALVCDEWGPDTGELSPTLKLKRDFLHKKYETRIKNLYGKTEDEGFLKN